MAENLDLNELFGWTAGDALAETENKGKRSFNGNRNLYKPSFKDEKCKDQTYQALVRFMPFFYENKTRALIERWECFLKDVNDENLVYVVSPKTVGKSCPMRNMSWKLYKSENAVDRNNSKKINVYQQWYGLIEVVKDPQHPEYEGKFFIYQFGAKIYNKIIEAQKGSDFSDPINPFSFDSTNLFEIRLSKGTQKVDGKDVTNYDNCRFSDRKAPLHFADGQTLEQTAESRKAYFDWINEGAPSINDYQWKEWDAETTEKVNANLATYVSDYSAPRTTTAKVSESLESLQGTVPSSPVATPVVTPTPVVEESYEAPEETAQVSGSQGDDDDWVDSILNN